MLIRDARAEAEIRLLPLEEVPDVTFTAWTVLYHYRFRQYL